MIHIAITGVGGPLGQALIKSTRLSSIPCRIIGTDRFPLSVGLGWVDVPRVLPDSGKRAEYVAGMIRACAEEKVALILPGSDSEMALLSEHAATIRKECGAQVAVCSPEILAIAMDKWETSRFLDQNGRSGPATARLEDRAACDALITRLGFPLIVKPCRGSGSRGLVKARSQADIDYVRSLGGSNVLEEYLQPDDEEYTVAVYAPAQGKWPGSICMRRELVAGNTYRAWVNQNAAVIAEAEAIVRAIGIRGPCNVQLRLTARGPVAFEINPRFSGTTAMRAHFGYNEVEMALRDFVLGETVPAPEIRLGIALRFWDETYFNADGTPMPTPKLH